MKKLIERTIDDSENKLELLKKFISKNKIDLTKETNNPELQMIIEKTFYISVSKIAEVLSVTERTIVNWCERRPLMLHIHSGQSLKKYIDLNDLLDFLNHNSSVQASYKLKRGKY